ncbi:MAG TPA: hypothetical protein VK179_16075 [Bacteroidales bacterium]|nr:hypothetical protein [Bacteroidales bacterium]
MKKTVILFVLTIFTLVPMMAQRDTQSLYEHKVKVYSRMSKTGWILTGIGSGFAVGGAVALATVPNEFWHDDDDYYDDFDGDYYGEGIQAVAGIISLGIGIGMLTGGIVMGSIGTHKMKAYKSKLDNISFTPVVTPRVQGFSLVYRF